MGIEYYIKEFNYRVTSSGYMNNIALVRLKNKITFSRDVNKVPNLPRASQNFHPSSKCWITGWGNVKTGGTLGTVARIRTHNIISSGRCWVEPETALSV